MDVVGVGFIGCGRIADLHARGYHGSAEARLVAGCDLDQTTAARAGRQWRAEAVYTDYHELLDDPRVDAVEILTPHRLHEQVVLEALARGRHVSVQKLELALVQGRLKLRGRAEEGLRLREVFGL